MIKRIFVMLFAALMLGFAGCSNAATPTVTNDNIVETWKYDSNGVEFESFIENGVITISLVGDGSRALYWKGTFVVPDNDGKKFVVESKADTFALKGSMLGSTDPTKTFTYDNRKLSFEFGAMGVTKTVEMTPAVNS